MDLTLKALANSSPGFALKPRVKIHVSFVATLKELRRVFVYLDATLSGFVSSVMRHVFRRVAKAQPWAGISERFQR